MKDILNVFEKMIECNKGIDVGDIADMMLDGTLCEGCGEWMGEPRGYPVRCAGCTDEDFKDNEDQTVLELKPIDVISTKAKNINCLHHKNNGKGCNRRFKTIDGMHQHLKDYHGRNKHAK